MFDGIEGFARSLGSNEVMGVHLLDATRFGELIKSSAFRIYINRLFASFRDFIVLGVLLDVVVAVTFTSFAILYKGQDKDAAEHRHSNRIVLISISCILNLFGVFRTLPMLR